MMVITMTSTSDEENVTNSDMMEHANSPNRPVSPQEPSWKPDGSRIHLHDHNYAARPTTKIITAQKSNSSLPHHLKIEGSGRGEDDTRDEISKPSSLLREELLKRNRQLAEASEMILDFQALQKQLAVAEKETKNLKESLEQEQKEKTDVQLQFAKFASSAAAVCCGVTVFIDELQRQFKEWCTTSESDIRTRDQKQFYRGLDYLSALAHEKLKAWLKSGIVTQIEVDRLKESFTIINLDQLSGPPFVEEKEESNYAATTKPAVKPESIKSKRKEGLKKIKCELRTAPCERVKAEISADRSEEVIDVLEEDEKEHSPSGTTVEKHGHANIGSMNGIFQCVCGLQCKSLSGLYLHMRKFSSPSKFSSGTGKQEKKFKAVDKNRESSVNAVDNNCFNDDTINQSLGVNYNGQHKACPARRKRKNSIISKHHLTRSRHMSNVALSMTLSSSCSSPPPINPEVPSCSRSSTMSPATSIKSSQLDQEGIPKQDISSEDSSDVVPISGINVEPIMSHRVNPLKPLECQCGYTAFSKYALNGHIEYYTSDRKFSCVLCLRLFENQDYRDHHYRVIHEIKQPIIAIVKLSESEIIKHRVSLPTKKTDTEKTEPEQTRGEQTGPKKTETFKPISSKRFVSLTKLKKRRNAAKRKRKLLRITAKERFLCQFCHRRFPHLRDLASHMARKIHGGEPFVSHLSTAKRTIKNSVVNTPINGGSGKDGSMMPTTTPHSSSADSSSKSTPRRSSRISANPTGSSISFFSWYHERHFDVKTVVQGERCECDRKCDKKKYKTGSSPPHCTICGHVFICVDFLRIHLLEVHNITSEIPNVGNKIIGNVLKTQVMEKSGGGECQSETTTTPSKPIESRRKRKSKPVHRPRLPTENEDQVVKVEETIHHHQVECPGATFSFKCSCGKVYSGKSGLNTHIREQQLGNCFKCPVCGLGFAKNSNLMVHFRRLHPGAKPPKKFSCKFCGKTFKFEKDRNYHRMTKHGRELAVVPGKK